MPALGVLAVVLSLTSEAAADRVLLFNFDGDSGRALRWRVAGALKRAGHKIVGVAPPKDPDDTEQLRAFARRRKVDVFVSGNSVKGDDGWELTLTLMNGDGDTIGKGVTFNADNLRSMIREIRESGEDKLGRAMSGSVSSGGASSGRASAGEDVGSDDPGADFAGSERARAKKKRGAKTRAVDEPLDMDTESGDTAAAAIGVDASDADGEPTIDADEDSAPSKKRTSEAKGWAKADAEPSEDDGRASFLSDSGDAESSGEVGADESAESSESDSGDAADWPTVVLGVNAGFVRRTLEYGSDIYGRLRAPAANAWVYRLQAAVYPFAKPVKSRIGLIAGYESEFSGVVRDNRAGTDFGVTFSELYGGLRLRQPLGVHEIALQGTFNSMSAGLDDPDNLAGVPDFSYTMLRAAFDVGLHFGPLTVRADLGYRLPIGGYGEASDADWFPHMEGSGIEGGFGLEYRISKEVAFDVSGSARRYLLQMNSTPEDARVGTAEVAGGAVDLYLGGYFGLNITL